MTTAPRHPMPRALADQLISEAAEILERTNDGNQLSPFHLHLVEHAVNARLSKLGQYCFVRLLDNVRSGYSPTPYTFICSDPDLAASYYRDRHDTLFSLKNEGAKRGLRFYAFSTGGDPISTELACHHTEFNPFVKP